MSFTILHASSLPIANLSHVIMRGHLEKFLSIPPPSSSPYPPTHPHSSEELLLSVVKEYIPSGSKLSGVVVFGRVPSEITPAENTIAFQSGIEGNRVPVIALDVSYRLLLYHSNRVT